MPFFDRLDAVRERWNVLDHPFYVRWSRGELSGDELAYYAGQYRHAAVALADATRAAAAAAPAAERLELEHHADEEASHVALWDGFVKAVGGRTDAEPNAATADCARAWAEGDGDRDLLGTLVALYAIEAAQPAISDTKRIGLVQHYGVDEGPGTAYFDLHATLDHEHAADGRQRIEARLDGADEDRLLVEAERVLRGNWALLDAMDEQVSVR
jgi:pyrroloquinoline-quinone synthase